MSFSNGVLVKFLNNLAYIISIFWIMICTMTHRCYQICPSSALLQSALDDLKKCLLQNGYSQGIIIFHVNEVLERNRNKRDVPVPMVPKKNVIILLPYLGP